MKHELKRIYKGEGITTEMMTPTCSCGWVGRGYEAYNTYPHSNVRKQEEEHIKNTKLENEK